ncbi:MAG: NAD-dependent epimerase/dehydratase family protein [Pseudomonadota bacterium]
MTRVAAITGASGFVGSHVTSAFTEAGWRCRVLARRDAALPQVTGEIVIGDLGEPSALRRLVAGADAVVHVAGLTASRDPAAFERVNVHGTSAIVDAWEREAREAPFVLVSSLAAREPAISPYAASKRRSETVLADCGGRWCVLRPAAVYGPRDAATLALFRMACAPWQPILGPEDARLCLIHAEDLADAIVAAAQRAPSGATWEVSDERLSGYSWREMASLLASTMGRTPRPVALPRRLVDWLGVAAECLPMARKLIGPLSRDKIRELRHQDWSSCADAQPPSAIWMPQLSLAEGFERTVSALETARVIKRRQPALRPGA